VIDTYQYESPYRYTGHIETYSKAVADQTFAKRLGLGGGKKRRAGVVEMC